MRAAIFRGPGAVEVGERPDPVIQEPTDAVVRVVLGCVRGSDLWYYRGESPHAARSIPGQMIVEVATPAGTVVLSSDAAHYHEELDHDRTFYIYSDMLAMLGTYDLLRAKAAQAGAWVVTGHDPIGMDRFERVNADCVDLTRPVT
jgi:hypothetical protein